MELKDKFFSASTIVETNEPTDIEEIASKDCEVIPEIYF
jgi:hypothetical protein